MASYCAPSSFSPFIHKFTGRNSMAMVGLLSYAPKRPTPISPTNKNFTFILLSTARKPLKKSFQEPSWQFAPFAATFLSRYEFCKRGIQTQKEPISPAGEDLQKEDSASVRLTSDSVNVSSRTDSTTSASDVKYSAASNLRASPRHDLAMIFTCRVCETRSVKTVCRESYEKGVVVVRCGGCNNLHLMADHLGWFGEPGSVEEFLAARGEEVKKGNSDTLSLTLEDLAGKKPESLNFDY